MDYSNIAAARTPTLTDIDAAFDRLSDEHKLLLIDHLADKLGFDCDGLIEGIQSAALDYARTRYRDEDLAAEYADSIIPQGSCLHATWLQHKAARGRTLTWALTYKPAFGAAA